LKITWLGQGGFLLESQGQRLCIDPYLSDLVERRQGLTRISSWIPEIADIKAEHYFCTHSHMDHFDPETLPVALEKFPGSKVLGPLSVVGKCAEVGIDGSRVMEVADAYDLGAFKLTLTPAYHSDKASRGVIVEADGIKVYISGDSEYRDSLVADVKKCAGGDLEAVFICINGLFGNMNYEDAARVVKELAPKVVYPMHYGLFAENTIDPQPFVELFAGSAIEAKIMTEGEAFSL